MIWAILQILAIAIVGSFLVPAVLFGLAEVGLFEPITERQRRNRSRR